METGDRGAAAAAVYPGLRGRRVFVTGGATGIGEAVVTAFASQGAQVAFVDLDAASATLLCGRIEAGGAAAPWWSACDVTDVAALQAAIDRAVAAVGDFDILVNNVGNDDRHALESVTPAYWDGCVAVNQRAAFFAIQSVVPGMRRRGGGAIVNLGSTGWKKRNAGYPVYAAAKASMEGLTRGLARSLGADRIRINTVTPGWVMTGRQVRLWLDEAGERELERSQCLPLRIAPEDVAAMVLFLASDAARACTAQDFVVDAGSS